MGWVKERGGGRVLPLSLPLLLYFGFCSIFLAAKTKNPIPPLVVPWSFFASKPHANACYAGYVGDSSPSLPKFSPRLLKRKRRNWWGKKVKVNSHIQYIKALTWLGGFIVIFLYLVWFSLYSSLFWELRDNGSWKICNFVPWSHVRILIYTTWFFSSSFFCFAVYA